MQCYDELMYVHHCRLFALYRTDVMARNFLRAIWFNVYEHMMPTVIIILIIYKQMELPLYLCSNWSRARSEIALVYIFSI
jgi:hypothetical protein